MGHIDTQYGWRLKLALGPLIAAPYSPRLNPHAFWPQSFLGVNWFFPPACQSGPVTIDFRGGSLVAIRMETDRWIRTIAAGGLVPTAGLIEVINPRPAGYTDFASTLVNPHAYGGGCVQQTESHVAGIYCYRPRP